MMFKLSYTNVLHSLKKTATPIKRGIQKPSLTVPLLVGVLALKKLIANIPKVRQTAIQRARADNFKTKLAILRTLQQASPSLHSKEALLTLQNKVFYEVGYSKKQKLNLLNLFLELPETTAIDTIKFYASRDNILPAIINLAGNYNITPIYNSINGGARRINPSLTTKNNFIRNLIIGFTWINPVDKSKHMFMDPSINPFLVEDDFINPTMKAAIDLGLLQRGVRLPRVDNNKTLFSLYYTYVLKPLQFKTNLKAFEEHPDYNALYVGSPGDTWRYSTHRTPSFHPYDLGIIAVPLVSGMYNLKKIIPHLNTYFNAKGKGNIVLDNVQDIENGLQQWNTIVSDDVPFISFPEKLLLPPVQATKVKYMNA